MYFIESFKITKLWGYRAPTTKETWTMKQNEFPPGWNQERVQNVIGHYEQQTEDEAVAEDEVVFRDESNTLMAIPTELVPAVLELIDKHAANSRS